ncbi:hypothetical protein C0995_009230 [Termitomyces sp. Mi166|nr:hypothetical protein C0995_009230 [Termitomyces sp. Mi166\
MSEKWKEAPDVLKKVLEVAPHINANIFLGRLTDREMFWVRLEPFLSSHGYRLRPRYRPDWIPSWRNCDMRKRNLSEFEDAQIMTRTYLMDAIRISDGVKVVMKCVDTQRREVSIAQYLRGLPREERNHTVPILDILPVPNDESKALIITPMLVSFNLVPFRRVGEFAEMVEQLIKCLDFLHEHGIAHRDACELNIMMDASKVIPRGVHFANTFTHDGVKDHLKWHSRWSVRPVQYYFIDFGLSKRYAVDELETITGRNGQDRSVPELLIDRPYDPWKVDVYQLGNVIRQTIEKYDSLEVFLPLASAMTAHNPRNLPSPATALEMLKPIQSRMLVERVWLKEYTRRDRFRIRYLGIEPY